MKKGMTMKKLGIGLAVMLTLFVIIYMCIISIFTTTQTTITEQPIELITEKTAETDAEPEIRSALGITDRACTVLLSVAYSKTSPDVLLIAPSGTKYGKESENCEYKDCDNKIEIKVSTAETGEWFIGYNNANSKLKIDFKTTDIEQPVITNVSPVIDVGSISVNFKALYGDGNNRNKLEACIIMTETKQKRSCIVADTHIYANEMSTIWCNVSNLVSSNDWKMSIIVYSDNNDSICDSHYSIEHVKYTAKKKEK